MVKHLRTDFEPFNRENIKVDVIDSKVTFGLPTKHRWFPVIRWITQKVHELFIQSIPSEDVKQYPPKFMYSAGFFIFLLSTIFFGALFGFLFYASATSQYLAPSTSIPGFSGASCDEVLATNTGVFLGTKEGLWEGTSGFQYSEAAYLISASNWKLSKEDYASAMNRLYFRLNQLGQRSKNMNLAQNLLIWFSFLALPDVKNPSNRFALTGDPAIAFNRQNVFGTVSSVSGDCILDGQTASYDRNNGQLILSLPSNEYFQSPLCMATGDPSYLGYNRRSNMNTFQIKMDIYSLVTAVAINLHLIDFSVLIELTARRVNVTLTSSGPTITTSQFYHPKFPQMSPIPCILYEYCFLRIGPSSFVIPFFHHIGNSTSSPQACDCTRMTTTEKARPTSRCNLFTFLIGFIYFPTSDLTVLYEFLSRYSGSQAHEAVYEASYVASVFGLSSPLYPTLYNTTEYRTSELYRFCQMDIGVNCSLVTFSLFDSTNPDWSMSNYYYQLLTGACQDQFTTTLERWQALIDLPFTSLTEEYRVCSDSIVYAFFNQLGAALGMMGLLVPLAILVVTIGLCGYQSIFRDSIPEAYSKEEKAKALDAFAISLLLARDQLFREQEKLDEPRKDVESLELQQQQQQQQQEQQHQILLTLVETLQLDSKYHGDAKVLAERLQQFQRQERSVEEVDIVQSKEMIVVTGTNPSQAHLRLERDVSHSKLSQVLPAE